MSEQVALAARKRAGNGKGEARSLRREGRVPAVAYGAGTDPVALSVDALELYHALHTDAGANVVLRLEVDGDTHLAFPREIHRHPVRREVLHLDFVAIDKNTPVTADVPLVLIGAEDAPGVAQSGVMDQQLHAISVEVLPLNVPAHIELDVSTMHIGDVKRVSDIPAIDGVTVLTDADEPVVSLIGVQVDLGEEAGEASEAQAEGATAQEAEAAESESAAEGDAAEASEGESE